MNEPKVLSAGAAAQPSTVRKLFQTNAEGPVAAAVEVLSGLNWRVQPSFFSPSMTVSLKGNEPNLAGALNALTTLTSEAGIPPLVFKNNPEGGITAKIDGDNYTKAAKVLGPECMEHIAACDIVRQVKWGTGSDEIDETIPIIYTSLADLNDVNGPDQSSVIRALGTLGIKAVPNLNHQGSFPLEVAIPRDIAKIAEITGVKHIQSQAITAKALAELKPRP